MLYTSRYSSMLIAWDHNDRRRTTGTSCVDRPITKRTFMAILIASIIHDFLAVVSQLHTYTHNNLHLALCIAPHEQQVAPLRAWLGRLLNISRNLTSSIIILEFYTAINYRRSDCISGISIVYRFIDKKIVTFSLYIFI